MSYKWIGLALLLSTVCFTRVTLGFCGFYVAKADTQLFNKASKVALVRYEDKTVLTMANDYRGDPQEFALVVPVPTFLERDQIHAGDRAMLDHLGVRPVLNLDMRLGEGSAAAIGIGLLEAAVKLYRDMATFQDLK